MTQSSINRRNAIGAITTGTAITAGLLSGKGQTVEAAAHKKIQLKGNIKHSACLWCYNNVDKELFFKTCAEYGMTGVDLVNQSDWHLAKDNGIVCTMVPGAAGIVDGLNDPKNHAKYLADFKKNIEAASKEGYKNVITFSGSRRGMSDEDGWNNCAKILKEAVKIAEDNNVIINMELLNSKVNHPDYQCDKTPWGVELCKRVGSDHFKLLYDIYHMQIMEGDMIRTIRDNFEYIGHFHTGGNPGRHEIDDTQEIYYPAVMKAILDLGYDGYVAQEFIPERDPLESLKQGIMICDV